MSNLAVLLNLFLLILYAFCIVNDVFLYAAQEKRGLLAYKSDLPSVLMKIVFLYVEAIHKDFSFLDGIEPH